RPARTPSSSAERELRVAGVRDGRGGSRQLAAGVPLGQRAVAAPRGQLAPERFRRLLVDLERALVGEDDAVRLARELDRREVVEDVLAHEPRVALERVAVAGGVRLAELDELARPERHSGDLRRQRLLVRRLRVLAARGDEAVPAAEDAARRVGLPVALAGIGAVDEETVAPDDPDP